MADKHPYTPGGPGAVVAAINQLRKSFPKTVDSDTLKKLSIAPKNESYIINILRFVGAIDVNGSKTEEAATTFTKSDDEFRPAFEKMVKGAYSGLFELYKDDAWTLSGDKLQSFFRGTDQTSELVGKLQTATFQVLAAFAGHGELPTASSTKASASKSNGTPKAAKAAPKPQAKAEVKAEKPEPVTGKSGDFGLTVRIEVNLPPGGDQDTYDKIFRSIRENLLTHEK